jgi:hypothetical protein
MSTLWDNIKLKIIVIIHILFVLFIVLTPFTNSNYLLFLHSIVIPCVLIHWYLNENICALTIMEKKIREKINGAQNAERDCFTCKIIEPIYDFKNNYKKQDIFIYVTTIMLWFISIGKLYKKFKNKEITKFIDLMKI